MKYLLKFLIIFFFFSCNADIPSKKPNIILIMTDDQGWGETGYYNHPVLKTPNLDAMANNGIRFDRFYASAPVCSPTRASVLTGRSNDRTGVYQHGFALRTQEKTITQLLKKIGYSTGHFGKWHLNGLRGPGVPILKEDEHNPGEFGFDHWVSTTNFFDINPLMSDKGNFIDFKGSSSKVIFNEAIKFIKTNNTSNTPFFAVIWDGSPHDPWVASEEDKDDFENLDSKSQNHYGELVAFDRNLGVFRGELKKMGISKNTILWFCSDNGGLKKIQPETVGGLKGFKGSLWEGGIRVPAIIEWPSIIKHKITSFPASTMDIFPTIADILGLTESDIQGPIDGISLLSIFNSNIDKRNSPIPFRIDDKGALIDNNFKLVATSREEFKFELYDLQADPKETNDISSVNQDKFQELITSYLNWNNSVDRSVEGKDYKEGHLLPQPERHFWMKDDRYIPYMEELIRRPEYEERIKKAR